MYKCVCYTANYQNMLYYYFFIIIMYIIQIHVHVKYMYFFYLTFKNHFHFSIPIISFAQFQDLILFQQRVEQLDKLHFRTPRISISNYLKGWRASKSNIPYFVDHKFKVLLHTYLWGKAFSSLNVN